MMLLFIRAYTRIAGPDSQVLDGVTAVVGTSLVSDVQPARGGLSEGQESHSTPSAFVGRGRQSV